MQRAVQMHAGFLVHRNPVGPGLGKLRNELVRILDHQVAIERQIGRFAQRLHQRRAHGEIGHKMAVHDVHMDDGAAAFGGALDLVRQMGEISRQNSRVRVRSNLGLAENFLAEILTRGFMAREPQMRQ